MTTPLDSSPGLRRGVYNVFWALGLLLGGTQVGFAAAEAGQPVALTVALAVYAFLGGAIGYVASSNTGSKES